MTGPPSTSPLASPAAGWTGADIRGLHGLAATLYGCLPEIVGVTTALNQEAAQLTGGRGWRGPVASSFTAAWQRDAVALDALAQVVAWTAAVVDDLAAELAAIETSLEDAAHAAGEQSRALTQRQAHDRAMAAARRASERAARRLTDVHAVFTAGAEPASRQVVGDPAGSIPWVAATGPRTPPRRSPAAAIPPRTCGTACSERPHGPMGAGGLSEVASRNGMTALVRSGERKMS
jgi:hypothetical protein